MENNTFKRMDFPKGMELTPNFFQTLELDANGEHLTGFKIAKDLSKPSDFVFVHGAGGGNYSRIFTFAQPVVDQGHSIVAFDHSGHGTSSGKEKESSLEKRVKEIAAVIDTFADQNPRTVCGSSMGGYIAIKMLEKYLIRNLILYCPAIYDKRAFSVRFDGGFTEILRRHESWRDTDATEILKKFSGNLLVIIGSEDKVIPKGVIDLIDEHSNNTNRKEILVIPGAPHEIHQFMLAHPEKARWAANKVAEFSSL